ncbi:MAG TPA: hypothetical protein VH437_07805 [Terriglobales bacterium]|jgi:hypothetical protein
MTRRQQAAWLIGIALALFACGLLLPRIPQPASYHNFADQRSWMGIPNFGDVASNLPFAIFGIWGLIFLFNRNDEQFRIAFANKKERIPYLVAFAGLLLTAFGSAYYHLAPDNARLVWDRLPMTLVFMSMVAVVIAERISVHASLWLLPPLLILGAGSVLEWYSSEQQGMGDLRLYAAVQVYAALVLLFAVFSPSPYTRKADFAVVLGLYALAKLLETADTQIFNLGHLVSGHTLKHIAAAFGGYWIIRMLERRRFLVEPVPF